MAIERSGVVLLEVIEKNGFTQPTGETYFHLPGKTYDETVSALEAARFEPHESALIGPAVQVVQAKDGIEVEGGAEYHFPGKTYDETMKALKDAEFQPINWADETMLDRQGLKPDA